MKKMIYIFFLVVFCSLFSQVPAQHNVAIRLGVNCTSNITAFSNYVNLTEGATYTVSDWTLPGELSIVQPLYNAIKGSTFQLESGALTEDIQIDWILWNVSCSNGQYFPNGTLTETIFNGYFVVYHKVNDVWTPKEPYPFSNGKNAVISLKNSAGFQSLLSSIPGGFFNLAFAFYANSTFDTTGLSVIPPANYADTTQFWVINAAHFSNIVGGNKSQITGINSGSNFVPSTLILKQNYPNPFNPSTIIEYSLPERTNIELNVFNILGVKVSTLVKSVKEAGVYKAEFNAANLSSGLYIYELKTDKLTISRKMLFIK